jgi:hypothetical protein
MFGVLALLLLVSPPHFQAGPGWHVGSRPSHRCVGVPASRCVEAEGWASTARYRDCADCVPPHRTLARLRPGGIVIQLSYGRERPSRAPVGSWPPRIRACDVTSGFEGEPDRYGVFQTFVRTGTLERYLFVRFGRTNPTRRQLARANGELRTVSYPSAWDMSRPATPRCQAPGHGSNGHVSPGRPGPQGGS